VGDDARVAVAKGVVVNRRERLGDCGNLHGGNQRNDVLVALVQMRPAENRAIERSLSTIVVEGTIGQRSMDGIPRLVRLGDERRLPRLLDLLDDTHHLVVIASCSE
jgi:hypothetical protein